MTQAAPDTWQPDVQALWDQGQRQAAIDLLLQRINATQPAVPRLLGLQLAYYVFTLGDLAGAERFLRQLLVVHPDDLEIIENLAVMVGRQGRSAEAVRLFERVLHMAGDKASANMWDGLTANLANLKRFEEARKAGERSLMTKTAAARLLPGWQAPAGTPHQHLDRPGREQRRDVIAFSLWGANPRYLCGALRNTLLIPDLYPGWQARFYLDETVPEEIRELLVRLGADCRLMPPRQSLRQRLCWRFHVANDATVGRFLVRDCDSVVNQREVAAVAEWLGSVKWFHAMRDWWTHTDPLLAGMWGGIAGVLPQLQPLLDSYTPAAKETANVDQWFLRDVLWGSIRPMALIHDRCFSSEGSRPWPTPNPDGDRHVGQNESAVNRKEQAIWLGAWLNRYPSLRLEGEDPLGLNEQSALDMDRYLVARWPHPIEKEAVPSMPDQVSGRIINLAEAEERWCAMKEQIDQLGWGATHKRFEAHRATDDEARAVGLHSGGQLGLWRSKKALLEQWLASKPGVDGVLHLVEDDAVLHPALPALLEPLSSHKPQLDLLFTEAFLSIPLYRRFRQLERQRQQNQEGIAFLNGGQYLACSSSVLFSRAGAERFLEEMRQAEQGSSLLASDIFMRQLIRRGRINSGISLPFFSTIRIESRSWIQGYREQKALLSQQLDLHLRRLLYYETWEPEECIECLKSLFSTVGGAPLLPSEIGDLASDLLEIGHTRGWRCLY